MANVDTVDSSKFDGLTIQVKTPEGTMFVTITEDENGKPNAIWITIGKAGASIAAWAHSLARILTLSLDKGATINDLCVELSGQTSDKLRINGDGEIVRSGPEGVFVALMKYKRDKYEILTKTLGDMDERGRGPNMDG